MGTKQYHFWYSKEQKDIREKQGLPAVFCLTKGEKKEHTTMRSVEPHGCEFDDMQYLGSGQFSHSVKGGN